MNNQPSKVWPGGIKPYVGQLSSSRAVGRSGRAVHVWESCPQCGEERWIKLNTSGIVCKSCGVSNGNYGPGNGKWKGGITRIASGYIYITVKEDYPFISMAQKCGKQRRVFEHRHVMAENLGRALESWEIIHHINGDKGDNRLENLELLPHRKDHTSFNLLQQKVNTLEKRVTLLEAENELLRSSLNAEGIGNPVLNGELNP